MELASRLSPGSPCSEYRPTCSFRSVQR